MLDRLGHCHCIASRGRAQLAFTYQSDQLKDRVEEAANSYGSTIVQPCDIARDARIDRLFADLGKHWNGFDILVHSVCFAPREALQDQYAPLRRSATIDEVGHVGASLCCDPASGITGEIADVDAGYNIIDMTGI